jgi:hypothetical protein
MENPKEQFVDRADELRKRGFDKWLEEKEFFGLNELVGEVQVEFSTRDDNDKDVKELLSVPVKIFLGTDIELPQAADRFAYKYPDNQTLLQVLFTEGLAQLAGQKIVLDETFLKKDDLDELKAAIKNEVKKNPLTLFYAHGGTQNGEMHMGARGKEHFALSDILKTYKSQYAPDDESHPVVLLASCTVDFKGTGATSLPNPGFNLVFRSGVSGSALSASGKVVYERPPAAH